MILLMTFWMKSAVGLPGRKPGMKPLNDFRFSEIYTVSYWMVE